MEFNANYRGIVLNNEGPYGQCKIYVPSVYPKDIDESIYNQPDFGNRLPWAQPALPIFGGNSLNEGMCSVPKVNSHVWVFFEEGDITKPIYFASIQSHEAWTIPDNDKEGHHVIKTDGKLTLQASQINLLSPVINMNTASDYIEDGSGVFRTKEQIEIEKYDESNFTPHLMYNPRTGEAIQAITLEDHIRLARRGFVHDRPAIADQFDRQLNFEALYGENNILQGASSPINFGNVLRTNTGGSTGGTGGGSSGGGGGGY